MQKSWRASTGKREESFFSCKIRQANRIPRVHDDACRSPSFSRVLREFRGLGHAVGSRFNFARISLSLRVPPDDDAPYFSYRVCGQGRLGLRRARALSHRETMSARAVSVIKRRMARETDKRATNVYRRRYSSSLSLSSRTKDYSHPLAFSFLSRSSLWARARLILTRSRARSLFPHFGVISDDAGACAGRCAAAQHLGRTSNDRSYAHYKRAQGTGDARKYMARRGRARFGEQAVSGY